MPPPQLQSASQEDISVVMGRFHAWDTARQKAPATNPQAEGVRELSYEEALAYSSPKRPVRNPLPPMPRAAAASAPLAPSTSVVSPPKSIHSEEPSQPHPAKAAASDAKTNRKSGAATMKKTVSAPSIMAAAKPDVRKLPVARRVARSSKPAAKTLPAAPQVAVKRARVQMAKPTAAVSLHPRTPAAKTPVKAAAKPPRKSVKAAAVSAQPNNEARQSTTFQSALAACLKESPRSSAAPKTTRGGTSTGKNALARTKAETRALSSQADKTVPRKPVESVARTISVNLRLSKAEHDRMRRGAAEAELSLATFIRESTLRYQIGREREQKLAQDTFNPSPVKKTGANKAARDLDSEFFEQPIIDSDGPGLLTRMKNFWLGRRLTAIA